MTCLIVASGLMLTACAGLDQTSPTPPAQPKLPANDTCNAARLAPFLGQPLTALETQLVLQPVRVIRPNQAVTMDYLENRLNILVTDADVVARLSCG